jgi:hypothetical protein
MQPMAVTSPQHITGGGNMNKSLTKFQKAKIIISTMYGLTYIITSNNKKAWQEAKSMSQRNSTEQIANSYEATLKILLDRGLKDKRDYIAEFVQQSIEGEQI